MLLAALPSVQPFVAGPARQLAPPQPCARPPRCVALSAKKKKKGPTGAAGNAALAGLEALEALEAAEAAVAAVDVPEEAAAPPTAPKLKKKKKDKGKQSGAGGAAADALAALEALEAAEAPPAEEAPAPVVAEAEPEPEPEPEPVIVAEEPEEAAAELSPKEKKRLALLAELDALEDDFDDIPQPKKKKKDKKDKKSKKKKDQEPEAVEEAEVFEAPTVEEEDEEEDITLEEKLKRQRGSARVRRIEQSSSGAATVRLEKVSVVFKNTEVLRDASWSVTTGDRVGLVGANGGGKTTQLKVLAGELEPTSGDVVLSSEGVKIAYLKQEFSESLDPSNTLREELASVFVAEKALLEELSQAEAALTAGEDGALEAFEELQQKAQDGDALIVDTLVDKVAQQMGFGEADLDALVASFSGGWKMRIGLAKVLLQRPDVLLLDEPTNHLDLESVEWLEAFLREQTLAMVIVSHDREFLDQVCTRIVDTDKGVCTSYNGNYSKFLRAKRERMQQWEAAYKRQQEKVKKDKDFINKNRAGSNAAQAKSREKSLEKLLASDDVVERPPTSGKALKFRFPDPPRCGNDVLAVNEVTHGYGDVTLFDDVSFELGRRDRVAILGANGAGKSTLLRVVSGQEEPTKGDAAFTSANVRMQYFAQNQADAMDLSKTVIRTIEDASALGAERSYNELRALLGQFLFKGDDVEKKLESLSGGEKARVALCTMMLSPSNVLFLDEPTNHLDIPAKEMLEDALRHFDGTVVVVSHDRYFVSQVANTIFNIEDAKLQRFDGDYASYMDSKDDLRDRVEGRYIKGSQSIKKARFVDLDAVVEEQKDGKKKFGGGAHGVSGKKNKGVKNAKRMA